MLSPHSTPWADAYVMRSLRTILSLIMATLCVLTLTGCQAVLSTRVDTTNEETGRSTLTLMANGSLAEVLLANPTLDQQLFETVAELSGSPAVREASGENIVYSSTVNGVTPPRNLLGYSGFQREANGEITVFLEKPKRLVEAITSATAGEPDSGAQAIAWANALILNLSICGPGPVIASSITSGVSTESDCATLSSSLQEWPAAGEWRISYGEKSKAIWFFTAAGVIAVAFLAQQILRRPRRD